MLKWIEGFWFLFLTLAFRYLNYYCSWVYVRRTLWLGCVVVQGYSCQGLQESNRWKEAEISEVTQRLNLSEFHFPWVLKVRTISVAPWANDYSTNSGVFETFEIQRKWNHITFHPCPALLYNFLSSKTAQSTRFTFCHFVKHPQEFCLENRIKLHYCS